MPSDALEIARRGARHSRFSVVSAGSFKPFCTILFGNHCETPDLAPLKAALRELSMKA